MSANQAGETHWIIPDAYIPPESTGNLISHESICVMNCNSENVNLVFTIFLKIALLWKISS